MEPQQEKEGSPQAPGLAERPTTEPSADAPAADSNIKTPDVTRASAESAPGSTGIPPGGSPPDGGKPGDLNGTSQFAGLNESINLSSSALSLMLKIAIFAGIGIALVYYIPLHFFPLDSLSGAGTVLAVFGFLGLLLTTLLELPFLFAAYGVRALLTDSKWKNALDSTRSARTQAAIWLLLMPPVIAAVALGVIVALIENGRTWWLIAIYLALAGLCILFGWWVVRHRSSPCIAGQYCRMTGYWMIFFLLVSILWTPVGNGLHGWIFAAYLSAVLLAGGWMAGVWASTKSPGMRMVTLGLPIFVAMIFGRFSRNFIDAVVGTAGVRVSGTTLILSPTAYREVLALGVGKCPTDAATASSAGCVAVTRDPPESTSKEYLARNVVVLSALGSRWLLGFPLNLKHAHPDCTPPRPGSKSRQQCMNLVLRSQDILMEPEGAEKSASSNRPQTAPKGAATSLRHPVDAAVPTHTH